MASSCPTRPRRSRSAATSAPSVTGRYEDGKLVPLDVAVDDEVIFSKYGGTEVKDAGEDYLILRESDILAKLVGSPSPPEHDPFRSPRCRTRNSSSATTPAEPPARCRQARRRRQGHARPQGPLRGAGQEVRRADDHQRRCDDRARDRGRGRLREPGRAARPRGRHGDQRRGRRRHHDRDGAGPGDRPRGPAQRHLGCQPDGPQARHREGRRAGRGSIRARPRRSTARRRSPAWRPSPPATARSAT